MNRKEFAEGVSELRRAFDLDDARPEVLVVWHRHLSDICGAEWSKIVERMIVSEEHFPRNLIRSVNSYRDPKSVKPLCFSDLERCAEDDDAARECFEELRKIGLLPRERVLAKAAALMDAKA